MTKSLDNYLKVELYRTGRKSKKQVVQERDCEVG